MGRSDEGRRKRIYRDVGIEGERGRKKENERKSKKKRKERHRIIRGRTGERRR